MNKFLSAHGVWVSYERFGSGPPLVLVHGGFSDHRTNWELAAPHLAAHFSVYAMARRGRGETPATFHHTVEDECRDAASLIRSIGQPVSLLGHSYGAHVALGAAAMVPWWVSRLVLYEAPRPSILGGGIPTPLVARAAEGDWDGFSFWFFRNIIRVPVEELNELRKSPAWADIVIDARASLGDLSALSRYEFRARRFAQLGIPALLQTGAESLPGLYVTGELAEVLPDVRVESLAGQAHEAPTTAPELYAASVLRFLKPAAESRPVPGFRLEANVYREARNIG